MIRAKDHLSLEAILKYPQKQLMEKMLGPLDGLVVCPFREDKSPTCSLWQNAKGNYYLHDFGTGKM
jgi:hypothetical protein